MAGTHKKHRLIKNAHCTTLNHAYNIKPRKPN